MVAKVEVVVVVVVVKKVLGLLADTSGNVGRPRRNWVRITKRARRTKFSTISHLWREEVGERVSGKKVAEEWGGFPLSSSLFRKYHHRHRIRGEKVVQK